ncbi:MAG: HNH endonuclease [Firmicutes bacterium]|nr:HNH endonuclease [Bacillota bacterium]
MPKHIYFDGLKFTRDEKTGYYLCSKEVNGSRPRLHRYVWEYYNGKIPEGHEVHHKDEDKENNDISNLELIPNKKHQILHGITAPESVRERKRKNVVENAMPKAKEWHGTQEGIAWHKEQGKMVYDKLPEFTLICDQCENIYTVKATNKNSRFCSNKCKSAWRRDHRLDDEIRICENCGGEFEVNKFSKTRCCSKSCGRKLSWKIKKEQGF